MPSGGQGRRSISHKVHILHALAIAQDGRQQTDAALMKTTARALPYLLSWGALAVLMIVGLERIPLALYTPIDGEWAKWNVEAILHFGKIFDLSPYSMLAGMGSMYFPNLPWLNPGALALALPLGDQAKNIASYAIYAAELAVSIVVLARVIGFSWLMATAAAQLYLYLLFPPFSEVFRIYAWYSLAPYYAHLTAVLNGAAALLLVCGRLRDWRGNALLAVGFLALFISGLLSAPFTFVFATPAYVAICAALILTRRPSTAEWAWKIAALALCLIFFFASGLLDYYLGTIATAGRTPTAAIAWDRLLSPQAWLRLVRDHSVCSDPRLLLCISHRGAWLEIAALCGAALATITRRGDIRAAAWALIAYIGLAHVYAYAYQAGWLGPAGVLSSHFLILSCWSFICMFAVIPFFEPFRLINENASAGSGPSNRRQVTGFLASLVVAALLVVIVVSMLRRPYDLQRYQLAQLLIAAGGFGAVVLAVALVQAYRDKRLTRPAAAVRAIGWRRAAVLSAFPILALVHLSIGVRDEVQIPRDAALRNYLQANASIEVGKPFRGYTTTIWIDKYGELRGGPNQAGLNDAALYNYGRDFFRARYGETFTETDLWRSNIPTFEEYGEWTSVQAHDFALRLLAPAGIKTHSNYLRAFTIDADILRALGVRYIVTDAESLEQPAALRASVSAPRAPSVRLFELPHPNLGTYSPTRFVKAATAGEIADRIREHKDRLDEVAVVSDDVQPTNAKARRVVITVERDGVRIRAASDGPAHILLPLQFSHCLVVVNGAPVRLTRANLVQTLLSFDGTLDARLEFHFGLFADNKCRIHDGQDNKALGM
jgi:hypothetical protein